MEEEKQEVKEEEEEEEEVSSQITERLSRSGFSFVSKSVLN